MSTKIEWTDETWNPITGCSVVSPGCTNCYAMRLAGTRLKHHESRSGLTQMTKAGPVWTGEVRFNEKWLDQPLRWTKGRMIFVCAHGDLFHENVPFDWIDRVFAVMIMAHRHDFQVLTKRPERMLEYMGQLAAGKRPISHAWAMIQEASGHDYGMAFDSLHYRLWPGSDEGTRGGKTLRDYFVPPENIWMGVSAEDQQRWEERVPILSMVPAATRFVSVEPMVGSINPFTLSMCDEIDWVIIGGESGPGARNLDVMWVMLLVQALQARKVAVFVKQLGQASQPEIWKDMAAWPRPIQVREWPKLEKRGVRKAPRV